MKMRYFVVNASGQLRKAPRRLVEQLWDGTRKADALDCPLSNELRLISVVCDSELMPRKLYVLRLPLSGGAFTEESYLTLRLFTRSDCVTPRELMQHHMQGWPANFFQQMAIALDVPIARLHVPLGVGGPLFLAAALRLTPREAVRHLR